MYIAPHSVLNTLSTESSVVSLRKAVPERRRWPKYLQYVFSKMSLSRMYLNMGRMVSKDIGILCLKHMWIYCARWMAMMDLLLMEMLMNDDIDLWRSLLLSKDCLEDENLDVKVFMIVRK